MRAEIWKIIEGFSNYEISNTGRVRSIERDYIDSLGRHYHYNSSYIKIEKQVGKKDNYVQLMVALNDDNHKRHRLIVARLVAKAFIPNPDNLPQVNHKDENSCNNNVENLEWCTASYNINYGEYLERRSKTRSKAVKVFDEFGNLIDILPSCKEASLKYKVSRSSISCCCNNANVFVKGFRFEFN